MSFTYPAPTYEPFVTATTQEPIKFTGANNIVIGASENRSLLNSVNSIVIGTGNVTQ